jgi:acyl-homoserine-lactone acylase
MATRVVWRAACGAVLTAAFFTLLTACSSGDAPKEYSAEVRRTSFGYPHIKADNEKGIGYGVGYAFAQDNFCLLAEDVLTINGERSKYFGPAATYDQNGSGSQVVNLQSDFFFKYINEKALVDASWARQKPEIQDLAKGFAAGVNRYLKDTGAANLPDACKDKPWVRNITELDVIRSMRRFALAGSGVNFIGALYAAQPPAMTAAQTQPSYTPRHDSYWQQFNKTRGNSGPGLGSNGVALGKDATESGKGLLLGNPHFPWTSPYRFYQLHLTIPGKVDALGASLSGFPVVNIGHNGNVAWTHTVNSSSHFTLFALELDARDPSSYVIDGVSKAMTKKELSVDVATGPTTSGTVKRTYYFSEHGPLVVLPGALEWTRANAYAFADANMDNDRMFEQWWAMDKSTTLAEFKQSIETTMGLPWVHAIATDKAGNAYYSDITVVPNVPAAKQAACVPPPFQGLLASGIMVLAGTTTACKWSDSAGAPQKGIFAASELPSMLRTDYVQNSNDSAWLTNPLQKLGGFPDIVSTNDTEQGGRTRIGLTQIAARLAGTDGLAGNKFSLAKLQDIAFSNRSYYATVLLADLQALCAAGSTAPSGASISKACGVLANWNGTANLDAAGWPLFDAWRNIMNATGLGYWLVPFSAADPVNTPRGLKVNDPAIAGGARQALAEAMTRLDTAGIDYTKPWGQIQVALRNDKRIPIHGGHGEDIYNAIYAAPVGSGLLDARYGSSTVITVSFETDPPTTQGWLTFSQSTDPKSPHYSDQTEKFSKKEWITFPYSDAQITADPGYTTVTIAQ